VNYYPHHIGDFNNATRHLTRDERSLYRELIELYYDIERPLPANDIEWICRKVMAASELDRVTVKHILKEFFILDGDVYRHHRCDHEISVYKARIQSASIAGKAGAEARRNRRSTRVKRPLNGGLANQEPITKNQEPRTNNQIKKNTVGLKPDALQVLEFLNEKTGRQYEPVPANLELIIARLQEGATVDDCRAVVAKKCREWCADERMCQYLRPATLFNRTKFAQYRGEIASVA